MCNWNFNNESVCFSCYLMTLFRPHTLRNVERDGNEIAMVSFEIL